MNNQHVESQSSRQLQRDLQGLEVNMNVYIQYTKDELTILKQNQSNLSEMFTKCNSTLQDYGVNLDKRVGEVVKKYQGQLERQFVELKEKQEERLYQEEQKRMLIQNKFNEYDKLLESLDKKWESKSNDRYIVTVLQQSLLNNKQLCQFIIDETIKQTNNQTKSMLEVQTKNVDDRIQQQYYLIQNFQTYIRKQERVIEDVQQALNVTREQIIDFQKQQLKKQNSLLHNNTTFKEFVSQQLNKQTHQFQSIQANADTLNNNFVKLQQQLKDTLQENDQQINFINQQVQQQQQDIKQNLIGNNSSMDGVKYEVKEIKELIQSLNSELIQDREQFKIKLDDFDKRLKALKQEQSPEKKKSTVIPIQQRALQKQRYNSNQKQTIPSTFKEQISIIEELFASVHGIFMYFKQMQFQYNQSPKVKVTSEQSPKQSLHEILVRESQEYNKSQPLNLNKNEANNEVYFNDSRIHNEGKLQVIGKQQALDIRPSLEMQQLQNKIKQVVNMLGDEQQWRQTEQSFSGRPNSARKKFPKINSKSLHFSLDD